MTVGALSERRAARIALRRSLGRLAGAVGVLWGTVTCVFLFTKLMRTDPVLAILGGAGAKPSPEQIASARTEFGLDRPVLLQYLDYLGGLVRGDLGTSYVRKQPVVDMILAQLGPTVTLTAASLVAAWLIAVGVTLLTAQRGPVLSALGSALETLLAALPQYWLGIMLLVVFAFTLHWLPVVGEGPIGLVLPALTLALPLAGFLGQVTRDEFASALEQPFAVSARARGMSDWGVRWRHALRHAVLPGLTLSGWALGSLFSTAVIVESIFVRPGLGRMLVDAVVSHDIPVVLGVTLFVAAVYILANLAVNLAFGRIDPRIREAGR